jgi:hypothetical protein
MFNWLLRLFSQTKKNGETESIASNTKTEASETINESDNSKLSIDALSTEEQLWVAFDEHLLEQARTQWQFGDWERLAAIPRESMQHHPERAKLAVLVAAGHSQCGNLDKFQQFIRLAQDWGCSRKLISQVLISGVQNSLGRASLAAGQPERAKLFFEQSVQTGMPGADLNLLVDARARQQRLLIGIDAQT